MRFHREIIQPEFDDVRAKMVTKSDMLSHMDDIYKRFDRLESEYQALTQRLDGSNSKWRSRTSIVSLRGRSWWRSRDKSHNLLNVSPISKKT